MSEAQDRCRFWPHCSIHYGDPRRLKFSPEEIEAMREAQRGGDTYVQIAVEFGTRPQTAWRAVNRG